MSVYLLPLCLLASICAKAEPRANHLDAEILPWTILPSFEVSPLSARRISPRSFRRMPHPEFQVWSVLSYARGEVARFRPSTGCPGIVIQGKPLVYLAMAHLG